MFSAKYTFHVNYVDRSFNNKKIAENTKIVVIPLDYFNIEECKNTHKKPLFGHRLYQTELKKYKYFESFESIINKTLYSQKFKFVSKYDSVFVNDETNYEVIKAICKEYSVAKLKNLPKNYPKLSTNKFEEVPAMLENLKVFKEKYGCDYALITLPDHEVIKLYVSSSSKGEKFLRPVLETQIWDCNNGKMIFNSKTFSKFYFGDMDTEKLHNQSNKVLLNKYDDLDIIDGKVYQETLKSSVEYLKKIMRAN